MHYYNSVEKYFGLLHAQLQALKLIVYVLDWLKQQ